MDVVAFGFRDLVGRSIEISLHQIAVRSWVKDLVGRATIRGNGDGAHSGDGTDTLGRLDSGDAEKQVRRVVQPEGILLIAKNDIDIEESCNRPRKIGYYIISIY